MSALVHVFDLPQIVTLTVGGGGTLMNYTVNRSNIQLFKGILNEVVFQLRDIDRKPVALAGVVPHVHVVDRRNRREVLVKPLDVIDVASGRAKLVLADYELVNVELGLYDYCLTLRREDGALLPVYTDRGRTMDGDVEVREGPFPRPREAIEVSPADMLLSNGERTSSVLDGAARVGNTSGLHTLVVTTSGFTGKLTVEASLDLSPPHDDVSWFVADEIEFADADGVTARTIEGNFVWIRLRLLQVDGEVVRILFKN